MDKYLSIWLSMEPDTWHTASELCVAPASMTAMVRRNYVRASDTSPRKYCRITSPSLVLGYLVEKHKNEMTDYIDVYCCGEKYPMMCKFSAGKVVDCYGRDYDITNAVSARIGTKWYELCRGKEIESWQSI